MSTSEQVILVDEHDNPLGEMEKLAAHEQALCHRAFSVFVVRQDAPQQYAVLLQQRHPDKYHCGGLWSNSCCSHPRPGESIIAAGERRLYEELGIKKSLEHIGKFHYIAKFANGLTENEVDHVLLVLANPDKIPFNTQEVAQCRWMTIPALQYDLRQSPAQYTPWLGEALAMVVAHLAKF